MRGELVILPAPTPHDLDEHAIVPTDEEYWGLQLEWRELGEELSAAELAYAIRLVQESAALRLRPRPLIRAVSGPLNEASARLEHPGLALTILGG